MAELAGVLVLAVVALAWVAFDFDRRTARVEEERAYAAGALFASWMQAAHRRTQEEEAFYVAALGTDPGVAVTPAQIRADGLAPDWLGVRTALGQTLRLGVIDDGAGVPMAFAVARPTRALSPLAGEAFRAGAAAGGVVGIEALGTELGVETFATGRRAAIEHAVGGALAAGDLVAVADLAIVFDENVVHRRRQPGREYLSEMRTDLRFASGTGIPFDRDAMGDPVAGTGARLVVAESTETSGRFLVGDRASVARDVLADAADGDASVEADVLNAGKTLTLSGQVEAGSWRVTSAFGAASGAIRDYLAVARATVSRLLDAGPRLVVEDELEATSELAGQRVAASSAQGRTGGGLSGTVEATGTLSGEHVSGQELRIAGQLQVTDRCYGCGTP